MLLAVLSRWPEKKAMTGKIWAGLVLFWALGY